MPRIVERLPDSDLAYIATAPPDMTAAEIARRLGRPYFTVNKAVRRIRRHGWATRLFSTACATCGGPILYGPGQGRPITHPGDCRRAWVAERARDRRKGPHTPSTKYVARFRRENPDHARELREREKERMKDVRAGWTPEKWAPLLQRVHESDRRGQEITLERATNSCPQCGRFLAEIRGCVRCVCAKCGGETTFRTRDERQSIHHE